MSTTASPVPCSRRRLPVALVALVAAFGCGGGAPLLHPAHVLTPGAFSFGAGASGRAVVRDSPETSEAREIEDVAVAPGIAPWAAARVGIRGSNEAGLTYTGRGLRADLRHAFSLGGLALSVGAGASVILAGRDPENERRLDVAGAGFDVPVLFGARSRSDLYALWIGPRFGFELVRGGLARPSSDPNAPPIVHDFDAIVLSPSFVAGLRAGFRHLHVALELSGAYHSVDAEIEGSSLTFDQVTLTPAGALVFTF